MADSATILGVLPSSAQWPLSTLAIDAVWIMTAVLILRALRHVRTAGTRLQMVCATADFAFVASSLMASAVAPGANPESTLLLGAGAMGLLCAISALRLSVVTTGYATCLGLAGFAAGSVAIRPSGDTVFGGAMLILINGSLCGYLTHRSWQSAQLLLERGRLARFLPREVADQISQGDAALGGREMVVTVLFSDLQGFTALSENLPPADIVAMFNEIRARMTAVVFEHLGTLDKFVGDATMAVFGAPLTRPDDAARALRCALAMRAAMNELNAERQRKGLATLRAGFGMHTGRVIAGNVGSSERLEYTVIGDAVNVAARVESLTRQLGADILCTAATREAAGDAFVTRALGSVEVKGRTAPVEVFAVG